MIKEMKKHSKKRIKREDESDLPDQQKRKRRKLTDQLPALPGGQASQARGLGEAESAEDGMMTEHASGENGTLITVSEDKGNAGMSKSVTVGNAEVNDIASQERGLSGAGSDDDRACWWREWDTYYCE